MNSEPYQLHVAIFPSLQSIYTFGGKNMLVKSIKGTYSKNIWGESISYSSKFIRTIYSKLNKLAIIRWDASKNGGTPATVAQIVEDLAKDNIPDVMLEKITFLVPYTTYSTYTMQNETFMKEWTFHKHTFRKTMWERLKAEDYPSKELYLHYLKVKQNLKQTLDKETYKRWRDVILCNEPHPELDNNDIRSVWMGRQFVLILKETRGAFALVSFNELK